MIYKREETSTTGKLPSNLHATNFIQVVQHPHLQQAVQYQIREDSEKTIKRQITNSGVSATLETMDTDVNFIGKENKTSEPREFKKQ